MISFHLVNFLLCLCSLFYFKFVKIYTSVSEDVLAEYVPFSTPKLTYYKDKDIPSALYESLSQQLVILKNKVRFGASLYSFMLFNLLFSIFSLLNYVCSDEYLHQCAFQYEHSLASLDVMESTKESAKKKISKLFSAFLFCLNDLGLWLALKVGLNLILIYLMLFAVVC